MIAPCMQVFRVTVRCERCCRRIGTTYCLDLGFVDKCRLTRTGRSHPTSRTVARVDFMDVPKRWQRALLYVAKGRAAR